MKKAGAILVPASEDITKAVSYTKNGTRQGKWKELVVLKVRHILNYGTRAYAA